MNIPPPQPTREQLNHLLAIVFDRNPRAERVPFQTFEPLGWLLRDDVGNSGMRRVRRRVYRALVRQLEFEFLEIDRERLSAANGPWTLESVYRDRQEARKCIRALRWCALRHLLHLPGAGAASQAAYAGAQSLSVRLAPGDLS